MKYGFRVLNRRGDLFYYISEIGMISQEEDNILDRTDCTFELATGKRDINNRTIFEGDYIRACCDIDGDYREGIVYYEYKQCAFLYGEGNRFESFLDYEIQQPPSI